MAKDHIPYSVKAASALLMMRVPDERGVLVPWMTYEEAKAFCAGLTPIEAARKIIRQWQFDHGIHEAIGGTVHPWNLTPRLPPEHRAKTSTKDIPQIAKTKRLAKAQAQFVTNQAIKAGRHHDVPLEPSPGRKIQGQKLKSRGFDKGKSRPLKSAGFRRVDKPDRVPRFSIQK